MKIFLACPFTKYLVPHPSGSVIDPGFAAFVQRVESALAQAGHQVFLAHRVEHFGKKLRPAHICTPFDMLEMQRADRVVALPRDSYGVHVELGWATAMDKPVIVVTGTDLAGTTPLLEGLLSVGRCTLLPPPDNLTSDVAAQDLLCESLIALLEQPVPEARLRPACAFLSTNFGFGPVSKAVTLAWELRHRRPDFTTHYFGAGIDYDFAWKSGAFDRVYRVDVDLHGQLADLLPHLARYDAVFSVLNLDILPLWRNANPLYFVDSLGWMWPGPPTGVENAARYFLQDYLLPAERLQQWSSRLPIELVGPIEATRSYDYDTLSDSVENFLLVNLSGCANPLADPSLYEDYAFVIAAAVLETAGEREVVISCNTRLADQLGRRLGSRPNLHVRHFEHREFLQLLASAGTVLTAPGITTTLEALALGKQLRFLLPQNYSQALISEHYRRTIGGEICMALSSFGGAFEVPPALPEAEGVALVGSHLRSILSTQHWRIHEMIQEMLSPKANSEDARMVDRLRANISRTWKEPGQATIISRFLHQPVPQQAR